MNLVGSLQPLSARPRVSSRPMTMATRRQFLRYCSAFALTASMAPPAFGACPVASTKGAGDPAPGLAAFAAQTGTVFQARTEAGEIVPLRLGEVIDLKPAGLSRAGRVSAGQEHFGLRFSGPSALPLVQGTYEMTHRALGPVAMFISRIGPRGTTPPCYEAIFHSLGAA